MASILPSTWATFRKLMRSVQSSRRPMRHPANAAYCSPRAWDIVQLSTMSFRLPAIARLRTRSMRSPCGVYRQRPLQAYDAAEETLLAGLDKRVITAIATARRFQTLKQDARHHSLRELALLRRIILVLDARLELDGMSFFLSFDELLGLRSLSADVVWEMAHQRQKERDQ